MVKKIILDRETVENMSLTKREINLLLCINSSIQMSLIACKRAQQHTLILNF